MCDVFCWTWYRRVIRASRTTLHRIVSRAFLQKTAVAASARSTTTERPICATLGCADVCVVRVCEISDRALCVQMDVIPCNVGDILFLLSDGVHDNLDPRHLGCSPSVRVLYS